MTFYDEIKELDIEHSSVCNLACPQCTRELKPNDYSWFNQTWLSNDFYSERIPQKVLNNLETIFFSGMVGDPCAAPNFLEVCKIIKERAPHIHIKISTNGAMRNKEWWKELATILGNGSWIRFAIDGLEDTNHIYRVNSNWNRIMENSQSFIDSGGEAEWQYIVFKHNEHQVDQARELSKNMNFSRFVVRRSHRWLLDALFETQHAGIQVPSTEKYVHPLILQRKKIFPIVDALKISNNSKVVCEVQKRNSVYISADGWLFPCVYVGTCVHLMKNRSLYDGWTNLWEEHGKDQISLLKTEWDSIISGSFFNNIKNSWNMGYDQGRLAACGLFCSESAARIFDNNMEYDIIE
jgi:MoaA/NifB/PqqE/SkfB family radical SAM enzyme